MLHQNVNIKYYVIRIQKFFKLTKFLPQAKKEKAAGVGGVKELAQKPDYVQERQALWAKLKQQWDEELAAKESEPIEVNFNGLLTRKES